MPPNINFFTIQSADKKITFKALFGDGSPMITDGYGGWDVTQRPKEIGIVEWRGRNPMQIEIPFMIDHWMDDDDDDPGVKTEAMVKNLESLCGIGGHDQPPVCKVDGSGVIPHDDDTAPGLHLWVVENVSWDRGQDFRSGTSGRRVRCGGTITIRQFLTATDILSKLGSKARARPTEIYVTKSGDTLAKVAQLKYHDSKKWKRIGDAHKPPLRDANKKLPLNTHLRIPR